MIELAAKLRQMITPDNLREYTRELFGDVFGDAAITEGMPVSPPKPITFSSILPYRMYDDLDQLYINARSYGFILEVSPLVGADRQTVDILTGMFTEGLPPNCTVQVINYASPKIGPILDLWVGRRLETGGIYADIGRKRCGMFANGAWDSLLPFEPFLIRTYRTFIVVSRPGVAQERDVAMIQSVRRAIEAAVLSIGMASVRMKPKAFLELIDEWINMNRSLYKRDFVHNSHETLSAQLTDPERGLVVYPRHLLLVGNREDARGNVVHDEFEVINYSARIMPEYWAQWQNAKLIGDDENGQLRFPCPFIQHFTFTTTDETNAANKAALKAARAAHQADDYEMQKYFPRVREKKRDWQFVSDKLRQGQKMVRGFYGLTLFAPRGKADQADRLARAIYSSAGWRLARESFVQLQTFLTALPFVPSEGIADDLVALKRTRTMVSWTCANLVPLQGEWTGNGAPCLFLIGRRGEPVLFDPFANNEGNFNVSVVGKSGSGKSVLMQEIVTAFRGEDADVIVIDDGESFKNSALLQGGSHVQFTLRSGLCINPFSMMDTASEDADYLNDGLSMVTTMVRQMARGGEKTDAYENGLISRAVQEAWNRLGRNAGIGTVVDILKENDDQRAKDLCVMLSDYVPGGMYGQFFNGQCNVEVKRGLTVFELAELKNKKTMQSIVVSMLMFLVSEKMYRGRRERKTALTIDEAWDFLRGEQSADLVEGYVRRCRKYRGTLITGTQSVNDYYRTPGALAAFENSDWMLLLSQKPESIEALKNSKRIKLSEQMERDLRSLRMVDRQYSEVMVYGPPGHHIGRLMLDSFSAALYSSKGEDFVRIQRAQEAGSSLSDAINQVAAEIETKRKAA